jgi:hypothetical protein
VAAAAVATSRPQATAAAGFLQVFMSRTLGARRGRHTTPEPGTEERRCPRVVSVYVDG